MVDWCCAPAGRDSVGHLYHHQSGRRRDRNHVHFSSDLLETEGPTILFVLAAPAIVSALGAIPWPRLRQQLRWVSGGLLGLGCLAGAMTIGVFYVPAAFMMLIAAGQTPNAFGWPSRRGRRRAAES